MSEPKYLQRYIDESVYRWNTRKQNGKDRFKYMFALSIGIFDYRSVRMENLENSKISCIFA